MDRKQFEKLYPAKTTLTYQPILDLICRMELLEEKIDDLQEQIAENAIQVGIKEHLAYLNAKEPPRFKVGWIYEHINQPEKYLFLGIKGNYFYTLKISKLECLHNDRWEYPRCLEFLKHETGKKWETEE